MEKKVFLKNTRRQMNQIGVTLLAYYGIMNVFVVVAMLADLVGYLVGLLIHSQPFDINQMQQYLMDSVMRNGWGYILSIAVGVLIVLLWKGKNFWRYEIFAKDKKMTVPAFFQLLAVFLSAQLFAQLFANALEWLLNLMGLSAMAAMESAAIQATGISLYLYVSILGPIAEELLFRGLVLRILKPWGKQAAIFISALVFGLFHGNLIQIPFAFAVGLVLGYVAVEHSIIWAIVLHIFNNMIFSDLLNRLTAMLPETAGTVLSYGIMAAAAVAAVVILICKRRQVKAYLTENKLHGLTMRAFFTSPGILVFGILMLLMSLLMITPI